MATTNSEQSATVKPKITPINSYTTTKRSVLSAKSFDKDKPCAEISFKEFLDFLRTAYQINEAVDGTTSESGNKKELDWKEVSANRLINTLLEKSNECGLTQKSVAPGLNEEEKKSHSVPLSNYELRSGDKKKSVIQEDGGCITPEVNKSVDQLMKRKLNELIQEGLLDSVLPYVVPKSPISTTTAVKKSSTATEIKKPADKAMTCTSSSFSLTTSKEKSSNASRRKSANGEIEVEIHVCDEVKNLKRDFRCPQKLLVSKMGYFAEVTTGQKLEDMDISVHCDVTIFDWLMRWVKKDENLIQEPQLDASNVVPILVSAAFLQMDPLLQDCLFFCRDHMNDIVQTSTNLSCLNDSILTRLSNLFSNTDLERLRDRKDKISSRLFCRLILSLAETSPEPARGHFASLASLYKCSQCGKLVIKQLASKIPCHPAGMKMDRYGNVTSTHVRDPQWNLSDYIRSLRLECKSWRAVYWRLWGDCHFLYCLTCKNFFPTHQMMWCCYHPEAPQYFTKDHQRSITFPIGRYPCCGERSYRFEPLSNGTGCQYKEHHPSDATEKDVAVFNLFTMHQSLIVLTPPQLPQFPDRITKLVTSKDAGKEEVQEPLWWTGLELAPQTQQFGLLAKWEAHKKRQEKATVILPVQAAVAPVPVIETSARPMTAIGTRTFSRQRSVQESSEAANSSSEEDSSSEGSDVSEESCHATHGVKPKPRRASIANRFYASAYTKPDGSCTWTPKLTTRMNQDNQRDNEQVVIRQMCRLLARKTSVDSISMYSRTRPRGYGLNHRGNIPGGSYVKVEQQWRERNCPSTLSHGGRQRSTASRAGRYRSSTTR